MLIAPFIALSLAQAEAAPDGCGSLHDLAAAARAGRCADLSATRLCLLRSGDSVPSSRAGWLLGNGAFVDLADPNLEASLDAGMPALPVDSDSCASYAGPNPVGGFFRDQLLSECLRVVTENDARTLALAVLEERRAAVAELEDICEAARSAKAQIAPPPEASIEALSAVLCRLKDYRRWTQRRRHNVEQAGGAENLKAAEYLHQLDTFLGSKQADLKGELKALGSKARGCDTPIVGALSACVVPPTLRTPEGESYVRDPTPDCEPPAHFDWYRPDSGWYLAPGWFDPALP